MRVVILAAGRGRRLGREVPKCLLEVDGETLLARHVRHAVVGGATSLAVVVGFEADRVDEELGRIHAEVPVHLVHNPAWIRGSILSFAAGLEGVADEDVITMDADVLYDPEVLWRLMRARHGSAALVDARSEESGEEMMIGVRGGHAVCIARRIAGRAPFDLAGESVGFFRFARRDLGDLRAAVAATIAERGDGVEYEDAIDRFFGRVPVGVERVDDLAWTEIDFEEDLRHAREEIAPLLATGARR
jgi:choline kinase